MDPKIDLSQLNHALRQAGLKPARMGWGYTDRTEVSGITVYPDGLVAPNVVRLTDPKKSAEFFRTMGVIAQFSREL